MSKENKWFIFTVVFIPILLFGMYSAWGASFNHTVFRTTDTRLDSSAVVIYQDGVFSGSYVISQDTTFTLNDTSVWAITKVDYWDGTGLYYPDPPTIYQKGTVSASATISAANMAEIADSVDRLQTTNHGSGAWTTGSVSGSGSDTISVYAVDTSGADATTADQFVTVKNASGATVITGVTDGTGLKAFYLDPATYTLIGRGTGYEWTSRSLVVSGNSTDTLFGQDLAVGSPSGGDMVRVFGYLKKSNDSAIVGAKIEAIRVKSKTAVDTSGVPVIISSESVFGYTDTLGYWFIDLRKTSSFTSDTTKGFYNITATYNGSQQFSIEKFYAPDVSTINLADSLAGR